MREAIGGSWLFTIVIVFLLLFTGYICLAMNYSKAYKVKNEVIDIIERQKELNDTAVTNIGEYLRSSGYFSSGKCDGMIAYSNTETEYKNSTSLNGEGNYCIKEYIINASDGGIGKKYYQVKLFFKFDLPVFGDIFNFTVSGDTEQL